MFKALLEKVEGVDRVEWQTSKTWQRNEGNHYCERNLLVYSKMLGAGYDHKPMEFELTRHQHTDDPKVKPTLTAMFKDPPNGMVGEAWRILLLATKGKQLLPVHAQDYCARHLARWQRDESHAPVFDSAQSSVEAEAGTDGQHSATRWTRSGHGMRVRVGGAATEKNLILLNQDYHYLILVIWILKITNLMIFLELELFFLMSINLMHKSSCNLT